MRLLVSFNEEGISDTDDDGNDTMAYQTRENLQQQIESGNTPHYPPVPISLNPLELQRWYGVEEDGEAIFTSTREYIVDEAAKTLLPNDGSQGKLYSYLKASCNRYSKVWVSHELQKQFPVGANYKNLILRQDLHQVHLHVANAYNSTVSLEEDTYVEVRFDKRLKLTDYTDPANAVRYEVGPLSSVFVQPDIAGRITLEIDLEDKDGKYLGAMMQYRFVSKKSLDLQSGRPVAFTPASDSLFSVYRTCNISFRMYERFNSDHYAAIPVGGVASNGTVRNKLASELSVPADSTPVGDIAQAYKIVWSMTGPVNSLMAAAPDNDLLGKSWVHHLKHRFDSAVRHAAHRAVSAAEKAIEDAKKEAEKALAALSKEVNEVLSDIENGVVNPAVDGVERIANAIEKAVKKAVAFAEMFWDWLMGSLDLNQAYELGQTLKRSVDHQLTNNGSDNFYSYLGKAEKLVENKIDQLTDKVEDGIDRLFKQSGDYDSAGSKGRSDHANSLRNSSRLLHLTGQMTRVMQMLDIDKVLKKLDGFSISELENEAFVLSMESAVASFVDVNNPAQFFYLPGMDTGFSDADKSGKFNAIKANVSAVFVDVSKFMTGQANYEAIKDNLGKAVGGTANVILDEIDTLSTTLIKVPSQILDSLNTGSLSKLIDPDDGIIKDVLEVLGVLLFAEQSKFKQMMDLALFLLGELVVLASLLIKTLLADAIKALKAIRNDIEDLPKYILDHFLDDVDSLANALYIPGIDKPTETTISNDNKILAGILTLVTDILDAVALFLVSIVSVNNTLELNNVILNVINAVVFVLRMLLKLPGVVMALLTLGEAILSEATATTLKDKEYYGALIGPVLAQTLAGIIGTVFILVNYLALLIKPFVDVLENVTNYSILISAVALLALVANLMFVYAAFSMQFAIQSTMLLYGRDYAGFVVNFVQATSAFAVNAVLDFINVVLQFLVIILKLVELLFDALMEFAETVWPEVAEGVAIALAVILKLCDVLVKNIKGWTKVGEDIISGVLLIAKDASLFSTPNPAMLAIRA